MNESLKFAQKFFGKRNIENAEVIGGYRKRKKIVIFIPEDYADSMIKKLGEAGAGNIGNYTLCSFRSNGTGTFRGNEYTNPYTGNAGVFEQTDEMRIEMICDTDKTDDAVNAMYEVHPYEEPAYEIYDVTVRDRRQADGAVITLKEQISVKDIFNKAKVKIDTKLIDKKIMNKKIRYGLLDRYGNIENELKEKLTDTGKAVYIFKFDNNTLNIKKY
jgi:hypothetical protein